MLPREVRRATAAYLRTADRLLPGQLVGCYLVGSTALGAYRPGRSDIDLVAVLDDGPLTGDRLLRRLRMLHAAQAPRVLAGAVRARHLHATCNVGFVPAAQLSPPVAQIAPVAAPGGHEVLPGAACGGHPGTWQALAERGVAVGGPARAR